MLKRPALLFGMLCTTIAVSMFVASGIANSQPKSKSSKKEETKKSEDEEVKGRLPRYYGQLELKEDQVTEVYQVQAAYNEEIQALEDKLKELREKMNAECEKVLTSAQKKTLADLREGSDDKDDSEKPKSSSKKKSESDKKDSDKKDSDKSDQKEDEKK